MKKEELKQKENFPLVVETHLQNQLLIWFEKNKRKLPWRKTKNPYAIWISEVMLQQTTSKAVIPYYEKFLKKFPNISSLAEADKKTLFPVWAGLGYYKRAENLILSARELKKKKKFPRTYKELLKLPGFGPYTSRAVSSLAFEESVGVLDGNVIRFLSRFHGLSLKWWKTKERQSFQQISDSWVRNQKASQMNQALMEIGSLICRSQNPLCLLCPLVKECKAYKNHLQESLPLKKSPRPTEFWLWKPEKIQKNNKWAFVRNKNLPVLKGKWIFPGKARKLKSKAKSYNFTHSIMHYQIFVCIQKQAKKAPGSFHWMTQNQIQQFNPSSLIKKVLEYESSSKA